MRIVIIAHNLRSGGGVSVGQNMIAALGRVAPMHTFLCIIPDQSKYQEICRQIPNCEHFTYRTRHAFGRFTFDFFKLRRIINNFHPDVILGLGGSALTHPPCPQALFPQNAYLFYPSAYFRKHSLRVKLRRLVRIQYLKLTLPRTQLLFCQSEPARRRLVEKYHYKGRSALCPNAVSIDFDHSTLQQDTPAPLLRFSHHIKLFYPTQYYPHKNLEIFPELLDAFGDELLNVVFVLTLNPKQHPGAKKLLETIQRRRLSERIINVGYLPQAELAAYYRFCDALFMPTLLESFSAAYVEAMHFGLPILTSDLDFAHAICGDAALYFKPQHIGSIFKAISRLKSDATLAHELIANGKARITSNFKSWDEIAAGVLTHLTKVVKGST